MKGLYRFAAPKRVLSGLLILAAVMPAEGWAAPKDESGDGSFSYVPEIHGALRSRYEMDLDGDLPFWEALFILELQFRY